MKCMVSIIFTLLFSQSVLAAPYWDLKQVPKNSDFQPVHNLAEITKHVKALKTISHESTINVLRIFASWSPNESYQVANVVIEPSGTEALLARSRHRPTLGSYVGILKDAETGEAIYYDSVGTGKEYRKLARGATFRFPVPTNDVVFELYAENPKTGESELVVSHKIETKKLAYQSQLNNVVVKEIFPASLSPSVRVNLYAEGYTAFEEFIFWYDAVMAVETLKQRFPGIEHMSFYGVFHPSNTGISEPLDLGEPVPVPDTFLGLYYPYWDKSNLDRWYNAMYPVSENKFRQGLATAPYDYTIVLVNNSYYWGVGNYMAFTAVPARSWYLEYLLLHEFGHFFGLNEEYEEGGPTELEFAPGIKEPWSQNITFLNDKTYEGLKWKQFVDPNRRIPTPASDWRKYPPAYGAYLGGYAESKTGYSYKPGFDCVMHTSKQFCEICKHAINEVVKFSAGS